MKNNFKLIICTITALLFVALLDHAAGQSAPLADPVVTVNYSGAGLTPGQYITIPVTITGTTVGNWQFLLNYDRDVLTFMKWTTSGLPTGTFTCNPNFTDSHIPGVTVIKCQFAYLGGTPGFTYSGSAIINLKFQFKGGSSSVVFYNKATLPTQTQIYYTYIKANPFTAVDLLSTFNAGSAAGSTNAEVFSSATGGSFKDSLTWKLTAGGVGQGFVPTSNVHATITNGIVTIDSSARCNGLIVNPTGKLTVNSLTTLSVNGNAIVQGDATGTGSVVDNGTITFAGLVSAQRYMTGNWDGTWPPTTITWHYVSSPVSAGTIDSFAGALLDYWDETAGTTGTWTPMTTPSTTPLAVNKGYAAALTSNQVITFIGGTLNTSNQNANLTNLTNSDATAVRGFNLIGNPYPSGLKWDATHTRINVDAAAYFWNGSSYDTHLTSDATSYQIPAEQGFYVHVTTGSNSGSMVLLNSERVHTTSAYVKSTGSEQLDLTVNGNNMQDLTSIRFNPAATEGFDSEYDAYKLWGVNACPQIYSITPDNDLAVNALPDYSTQTVIPVGCKVGVNGTYTLTASGLGTFPSGTDFYLEDLLLNKSQNLTLNPVYEFTAAASNPVHRFNIHFSPLTGIGEGTSGKLKIYASEKNVYVNIPMALNGQIIVYDLLGKEMKRQQIQGNSLNKVSLDVQLGYYLVKVLGDKTTLTGKVFIR